MIIPLRYREKPVKLVGQKNFTEIWIFWFEFFLLNWADLPSNLSIRTDFFQHNTNVSTHIPLLSGMGLPHPNGKYGYRDSSIKFIKILIIFKFI